MRVVCLSDTHGMHNVIGDPSTGFTHLPEGDVLVHAGDALGHGRAVELYAFLNWMNDRPHKHKIYVAGNHDAICEEQPSFVRGLCEKHGIHYLFDSGVTIDGVKFWGTPYTPMFFNWHFMAEEPDLMEHWENIPDDTDVLISHGPPFGILDQSTRTDRCGSPALSYHLARMKNLKGHIFGHIHHGRGVKTVGDTTFVNAAFLNDSYDPWRTLQPVLVLEDGK